MNNITTKLNIIADKQQRVYDTIFTTLDSTVKSINGTYYPDASGNVEIPTGGGSIEGAVLYTKQELAPEDQEQARANIEVPHIIVGEGEPMRNTKGAVGDLYMNGRSGGLYKCTEAIESEYHNEYTWVRIAGVQVDMGPPNSWIIGEVGELYMDNTNGDLYICSRVDEISEAEVDYIWVKVGGSVDLSNYYTIDEVDGKIGDISSALDGIIALQNAFIGGGV